MTKELKNRLELLSGKTKVYEGKVIKIKNFKDVNGTIVIFTDGISIALATNEIDLFFDNLSDVKEDSFMPKKNDVSNEVIVNGYAPSAENKVMKASLLNVLSDLQNGEITPEKERKAMSVCGVINTMVNMQKVEVQLINSFKK
ncbi:hypothetical protein [Polaribacter sp. IC073]|uniref:hypothetical protein n=1 Tax=Polaribacter sp. IC073 TaxID=2508540 RepID=UPI0011BEC544|nr:hypothetical protein [Polaribacter sp. IC073]TXD45891.1 hypothetical protein ES045_15820 [Polaribacter sp. IC073]